MAEWFSAFDLCSDGRVVKTVVLVSLSKTLNYNCMSSARSINVRAEMVIVFD